MPYIKNSRGVKEKYTPVKISKTLSELYFYMYGKKAIQYRGKVIEMTKRIYDRLSDKFGDDETSEWPLAEIRNYTEREVRQNTNETIHKTFLLLNPPIIDRKNKEEDEDLLGYSSRNILGNFEIDPVWNVITEQEFVEPVFENNETLLDLGTTIRIKKARTAKPEKKKKEGILRIHIAKRRSDWIQFWKRQSVLTDQVFNIGVLEKIVSREDKPYTFDSEGWWIFWENAIFEAIKEDPRLFVLLRLAQQRKARACLVGQDWLDGSGLNQKEGDIPTTLYLMDHSEQNDLYRLLWKENMKRLSEEGQIDSVLLETFNLDKLSVFIDPGRDKLIDWRGYQYLRLGGCLWDIPSNHNWNVITYPGIKTQKGSKEPPQWAFMRLAMALCVNEAKPWDFVLDFYNQFSQLTIIPSESMLRQAGRKNANFLEDKSTKVEDKFESIYEAIHQSAVGTKWTGTVSMDWSKVRSVGSPVKNGVRKSRGILQFAKTINESLLAQNRTTDDRPVTMALPLWHLEVLKLIRNKEEQIPNLQSVIYVSDLFMKRLMNNEPWTLFDPVFFPELQQGSSDGYLLAESLADERMKIYSGCVKKISSQKLWGRILNNLRKGEHSLVFEDSNKAYEFFPKIAPGITGLDGVGLFPLPASKDNELSWIKWPSMAVNLLKCIDEKGMPQLDKLNEIVSFSLRMLDNAITLSISEQDKITHDFRSICLGNIGFYEAIDKIIENQDDDRTSVLNQWISGLTEAWSMAILIADQELVKERGAAKACELYKSDLSLFDPIKNMEKLKEMRGGALKINIKQNPVWNSLNKQAEISGYRFINKSCWAPFKNMAGIAGVSPGGIGSLQPVENIEDEKGISRWIPTPLLLNKCFSYPDKIKEYNKSMKQPGVPRVWESSIKDVAYPNEENWKMLMEQAALIRPWNDQGVSVTLPIGLPVNRLNILIQEAWWYGLNVIRFEKALKRIENKNNDEENEIEEI